MDLWLHSCVVLMTWMFVYALRSIRVVVYTWPNMRKSHTQCMQYTACWCIYCNRMRGRCRYSGDRWSIVCQHDTFWSHLLSKASNWNRTFIALIPIRYTADRFVDWMANIEGICEEKMAQIMINIVIISAQYRRLIIRPLNINCWQFKYHTHCTFKIAKRPAHF